MQEHRTRIGSPPPLPTHPRQWAVTPRLQLWPGVLLLALLVGLPLFIWFGCRIEPGPDQIAVLIRKTGKDLPSGTIIAPDATYKGIQLEVLPEGRYFKNPYTWGWRISRVTDIPAGQLGIRTRLFGEDLPPGHIMAMEGTKGILSDLLRPGKYRINPYAYQVQVFDAITIRPGHIGVVTSLIGADVLNNNIPDDQRNEFLVGASMKGVLPDVRDPGTYYLNPYILNVVEVNLQSQRFEMSGKDVIGFLTQDGFTVTVEGTVEFALQRDKAALLTHRVGDMDDVTKKIILPRARGFSRIEGSKHPAIDFIVGETRQKFQDELESDLRAQCIDWGVDIKSVLIRKIIVPDEIASINREREIAVQDAKKYEQQITQARSKAELTKQEMLAVQNKERVTAETAHIRAVINAEQDQAVRVIAANKNLEVAKVDLQAAAFDAEAIRLRSRGEQDAIRAGNQAEAEVLKNRVDAFGDGMGFARYTFYESVAPKIRTVLSSDDGEGLGGLFLPYLPAVGREVAP
jgi:regulator of protease activity HflC (stomatin/prohibitin superfamily)